MQPGRAAHEARKLSPRADQFRVHGHDAADQLRPEKPGIRRDVLLAIGIAVASINVTSAQTARAIRDPAAVIPLAEEEPLARIIIDPPDAEWLAQGRVVIQCRTENLRVVQVFSPAALAASPRVGHVHVTVDEGPFGWADASGEAIIINRLPFGPHKVLIKFVNASHQTLDRG